ncbi:TonB family protein [Salmonirosea aquatica]
MEILTYIAKVSLYWVILYACYWLVLRRHTFFILNRTYLLGALIVSLGLPLVNYTDTVPPVPAAVYELTALPLKTATTAVVETTSAPVSRIVANTDAPTDLPFPWADVLGASYLAGALFMLGRLVFQGRVLFSSIQKGERIDMEDYTLVLSHPGDLGVRGSFSFLRWVVISPADYAHNFDTILSHELVHVRQRHSWDILLVEVLGVLFWFNPVLILYKKSLQQIHEYLADRETALAREAYAHFLLAYALNNPANMLTNNFLNPSHLKSRIMMLYKNRNSNWALGKYAAVVVLISFVSLMMAFKPAVVKSDLSKNDTLSIPSESTIAKLEERIILAGVGDTRFGQFIPNLFSDEIPLKSEPEQFAYHFIRDKNYSPSFPGGNEAMQKFMGQKVTYPASAVRSNVQGKVLLNFVVSEAGEIQNVEILKDPGFGLKEESLRLIAAMPAWVPGQKDGKNVAMHYEMTLDFQLSDYKTIVAPAKVGTLETQVNLDGERSRVAVVKYYPKYNRDRRTVNYRIFHNDTLQNALYILNAMPMKNRDFMKDLTMDELQSVRVLNSTTARRLYGEKGANGVVQVFTKKSDKN